MTNSKSVDNYRFMTAEPFVMNNRAYCLIDGVQFVIYTIAPLKACRLDTESEKMMKV